MTCLVYWLHDTQCICPWKHGYVGISSRWHRRLWRHQREGKFPPFEATILFRGTRDECLELEEWLRPTWRVGWNNWKGGRAGPTTPKTLSTRENMRLAALKRFQDPREREKQRINNIGKHDHRGENNPRFGKQLSEEEKKNISIGRVGKGIGNQNWRKRKPYSEEALRKMSEASKRRWEIQATQTKEK